MACRKTLFMRCCRPRMDSCGWARRRDSRASMDTSFASSTGRPFPALPGDDIRCLLEDRTGGLWVGTASGLTRLKNGRAHTFSTAEGLPGGALQALVSTDDGGVWVLTAGGLAFADVSSIDAARTGFSQPAGLESVTALSITPDGGGGLWIATVQGLRHMVNGRIQRGPDALGGNQNRRRLPMRLEIRPRCMLRRRVASSGSQNGNLVTIADAGSLPAGRHSSSACNGPACNGPACNDRGGVGCWKKQCHPVPGRPPCSLHGWCGVAGNAGDDPL